jgi:flagellar assembly protein FliH
LSEKKIIKAVFTRLLPAEMRLHKSHKADFEASEAADTAGTITAEDLQAAYDEVIEAARQETVLLLRDAREESKDILERAAIDAERMRSDAYDEGLKSGSAEGHEKAYSDFMAHGEKVLSELVEDGQGEVDKSLASVYAERDRMLEEMEPKILRLSLDIGEKILGYELDEKNEAFVSMVKTALNVIRCEGRVTVRVNAERHKNSFDSKAETLFRTDSGVVEAEIVSDPGVEPDGCLIDAGNGVVDASADIQLEQISRNLGFP